MQVCSLSALQKKFEKNQKIIGFVGKRYTFDSTINTFNYGKQE
jgi:hypothetical protein